MMNKQELATGFKSGGEKWVLGLAITLTYVLMIFGNVVTTTGSGLACPDWPLCYGTVNPPKEISVWIEWGHRLIGGTTGIFILASAFLIWKKASSALKFFLKIAVGLILLAVLLGGAIIIVDAPLLDSVLRITVVSSHIIVATVIFTTMIVAYYSVSSGTSAGRRNYQLGLFALVYLQIVLGIIVRYSRSSMACPDWPLCQGSLLPPLFTPEVMLHYTHRLVAYTVFFITLWDLVRTVRAGDNYQRSAVTFGLVLLQASIGIGIIQSQMFLPLLVLHGAVGFLFLGWVAYLGAPFIAPAQVASES
ncbi:MAG: heme A synthase [Nitrospinae bacterium]|nr:heme A synthase [Nitrospinota bacterium]